MKGKQHGFTFVELVIVVVVLGLLAAVALPRFINLADEAEISATKGVAGGFASSVGMVRGQWEVDGRPGSIILDGYQVDVNRFGYPGVTETNSDNMTASNCATVFTDILQSHPSISAANLDSSYFTNVSYNSASYFDRSGASVSGFNQCVYFASSSVSDSNAESSTSGARGFTYNHVTGQVEIFIN